ncbi:MAG: hypothetical protein NVS3B16_06850 [Vulcanimicrobiaceae bacterium]
MRGVESTRRTSASDVELLTFGGIVIALVWAVGFIEHHVTGTWESHRAATEQWFALGVAFAGSLATAFACATPLAARAARAMGVLSPILLGAYRALAVGALLIAAGWLVVDAHRSIALLLGLGQALILLRLAARRGLGLGHRTSVVIASVAGWIFAAGFSYTPIAEWLLGATWSTAGAALAVAAARAIVPPDGGAPRAAGAARDRARAVAIAVCACAVFAELGFRTDHLYSDWIPYHRSFWVGAADFVRQGGWLLWDVPSQYGFLSALSLAVWPAASTWQALYEQSALTLVFDAMVLFALLRYGRAGAFSATASIAIAAVVFFSSLGFRFPFGWRLYPQLGLRFTGVVALLGLMFVIYRTRERGRLRTLAYAGGYAVWAISLLWSFESGAIATLMWLPFVAAEYVRWIAFARPGWLGAAAGASKRLLPFVVIAVVIVASLELVYRIGLKHAPDWRAYVEFAYTYNAGEKSQQPIQVRGPGWVVLTFAIVAAATVCRAVRARAFDAVPLLVACWFAVWGVSNYYVSEGFNDHVNGIAPIFITVFAVWLAVDRAENRDVFTLAARAFALPILVLVFAQAVGSPSALRTMSLPFSPGFSGDSLASAPPLRGEITALMRRAGVRDTDLIVFPASAWEIKTELGMILPFVKSAGGGFAQRYAWLPISPVGPYNELQTLPKTRARTYLARYYAHVRRTGWFVVYHRDADCSRLLPDLTTVDVVRSVNYQIARCRSVAPATVRKRSRG